MELQLNNHNLTKSEIKRLASVAFEQNSVEELLALAVRMETAADEIRKIAKDANINAYALESMGVKVGEYVCYDYSNSPAWNHLQEKLKNATAQIKADIKEVESLAKVLHGAWERGGAAVSSWTDRETGEILEVRPAKKLVSNKLTLL